MAPRYGRRKYGGVGDAFRRGLFSGIIRGLTGVAQQELKKYSDEQIKKLKEELESGRHHRHNLHNKFTPSADHAKRALLNIGKTYTDAGHLRRGISNAHYIKKARAGKRSQLKYSSSGLPKGIQKRFRMALAAKAANQGRRIKGKTSKIKQTRGKKK